MNSKHRNSLYVALWTGIIVLFFTLRLVHLSYVLIAPPARILIIDSLYYFQWAERIASGQGVGPTVFFMSPLYPLFLSLGMQLSIHKILAAFLLQVLLSAGTLGLLGMFTTRRFGRTAGLVAGLMYAIYAPSIYYDGVILTATLILFLTMLALTFMDAFQKFGGRFWIFTAGMTIGLSALARPNALILLPVFALVLIQRWKREGWEHSALLVAGALLVTFPAGLHNYLHGGEWYLTTNSAGVNMYIGNNPNANGLYTEAPWLSSAEPYFESADYRAEVERRVGHSVSSTESSRYWMREAFRWIAEDPFGFAITTTKKFMYFMNRIEAPNNVSFFGVREYSGVLRLLTFFNFGILAPFGFVGLFLARKEQGWDIAVMLVAGYLVASLLFFVAGEYRYPVTGVLLAYGAGAIVRTIHRLRAKEIERAQLAMMGILSLLLLCNIPWQTMKTISSPKMDYFNWASVSFARGDLSNASLLFTAALAWDPAWAEAHIQLAQVYDEMDVPALAESEYAAAGITREELERVREQEMIERILPDSLLNNLQQVSSEQLLEIGARFNRLERFNQAVLILERAVEKDSTNLEARFQYGFALEALFRFDQAMRVYQELELLDEDDPMIPYRIAWVFFASGNAGSAQNALRRARDKAERLPSEEERLRWREQLDTALNSFMNY